MGANDNPLERFIDIFRRLDKDSLQLLDELYAPNAIFEDPLHRIEGLPALREYFGKLYNGVISIEFAVGERAQQGERGALSWIMTMRHKKLKGGAPIAVHGASFLRFNSAGLIVSHRDYFDLGEMLYENIPLLGAAIRLVRRKV